MVVAVVVGVVYTSLLVVLNWPVENVFPPTVTLNVPLLAADRRSLLACCRIPCKVVLPCKLPCGGPKRCTRMLPYVSVPHCTTPFVTLLAMATTC